MPGKSHFSNFTQFQKFGEEVESVPAWQTGLNISFLRVRIDLKS